MHGPRATALEGSKLYKRCCPGWPGATESTLSQGATLRGPARCPRGPWLLLCLVHLNRYFTFGHSSP